MIGIAAGLSPFGSMFAAGTVNVRLTESLTGSLTPSRSYENGRITASIDAIVRLAEAFDVTTD
jgi:hypothetical protein